MSLKLPRLDHFTLATAALAVSTSLMQGIRAAKVDDGKVDAEEAATITVDALSMGVTATGVHDAVVYTPGEYGTLSIAGRLAAGLIAAGRSIQDSLADRQVTFGECVQALSKGVAKAFAPTVS